MLTIGMHECIANIAPYGVSPLVRLPDKERWMIKRALDAGAHGIMVPLLATVDEVKEVVRQVYLLSLLHLVFCTFELISEE